MYRVLNALTCTIDRENRPYPYIISRGTIHERMATSSEAALRPMPKSTAIFCFSSRATLISVFASRAPAYPNFPVA